MKKSLLQNQDRRESILKAAAELCAKQGIVETNLRQIAGGAGISNGTLHYHFPSKETLIETLVLGVVKPLGEEAMRIARAELHPRAQIELLVRLSYRSFDADWDRYYVALILGDQVRARLPKDFPTATRALREIVARGQIQGLVREGDAGVLAILCHGMITRIPRGRAFGELVTPLEQYVEEVTEACWRVLATPVSEG